MAAWQRFGKMLDEATTITQTIFYPIGRSAISNPFVYDGYAVFEFREESLIPWQFLLCAMDIGLMDILMAKRAKAL